jgi:hypothetical protein
VYNVYCHCGQIAPIFGLASEAIVSDIIYSWANLLNVALKHMFQTPTKNVSSYVHIPCILFEHLGMPQ